MKILNKNKIIVSALALAIGGSLAGSVSGTIAWYQYSTRANVAYVGEASGVSSNLQMRFKSESGSENAWRTRITWQEMNNELGDGMHLVPMTFGKLSKDDALPANGYVQPAPGVADMTKWKKATNKNYAQSTLQVRNINREAAEAANDAQDVYLSKLVLQKDLQTPAGKEDISNALRVHISSVAGSTKKNKLISKLGGNTNTSATLDIDGDGDDDQAYPDPENDEFGFSYDDGGNPVQLADVIYGDQDKDGTPNEIQSSYSASYLSSDANAFLVYSENNYLYNDDAKTVLDNAKSIGQTLEGSSGYLEVTITIWIEGWQEFNSNALWDATKYVDSKFDVGIQFAIQDRQ